MEIYHPKDEELLREMKRVRRVLKRKRLLWGLLIFVVLGAVFGWFVFHRYCAIAVVRGDAMGDTLPDGSIVLVWREDGRDVERGDIILYETETGAQIKRVLALPGDQVVISPNTWIRINGDRVNEPYAIGRTRDAETGGSEEKAGTPSGSRKGGCRIMGLITEIFNTISKVIVLPTFYYMIIMSAAPILLAALACAMCSIKPAAQSC